MTEKAKPGQYLKYEREKRGISVEEIAHVLNLPVSTIVNLEKDDYEELPELVYVRGYIRAYCTFLDVDYEPVLGLNPDMAVARGEPLSESTSADAVVNERVQQLTRIWGSIVVFIAIAALVFIWWEENMMKLGTQTDAANAPAAGAVQQGGAEPAEPEEWSDGAEAIGRLQDEVEQQAGRDAAENAQAPEDGAEPPPPAEEMEYVSMTITANMRSWVLIHDGDRNKVIHRIVPVGYENHFDSLLLPMYFALGDARGIRLWFDGAEYNLAPHINNFNNTAFFHLEEIPEQE